MILSVDRFEVIEARWQTASWSDYEKLRDDEFIGHVQLFFNENKLLVENMGGEGIDHAKVRELFIMIFGFWYTQPPEVLITSIGGCLPEKQGIQAAAPDLILYVGGDIPIYREGERRYIDLNRYRVPDLAGEVSDTTLASDMRQKWDLYAELGIREYWVIDIKGKRVFAFSTSEGKTYVETEISKVLGGLKIDLLNQTLERLSTSNVAAAAWFNQQVSNKEDNV